MVFIFQFVYVVNYIDRFSYVKPLLHLWDEAYIIMVDNFLMCSWILFVSILLSIFASMFMREIGLKFSFLVEFLYGVSIGVLAS